MKRGDKIKKVTGDYTFNGRVLGVVKKLDGKTKRIVAESTVPGMRGAIMIFNEKQLRRKK